MQDRPSVVLDHALLVPARPRRRPGRLPEHRRIASEELRVEGQLDLDPGYQAAGEIERLGPIMFTGFADGLSSIRAQKLDVAMHPDEDMVLFFLHIVMNGSTIDEEMFGPTLHAFEETGFTDVDKRSSRIRHDCHKFWCKELRLLGRKIIEAFLTYKIIILQEQPNNPVTHLT
jgi:hypothetical protein